MMDDQVLAANLAAVEAHFHSEAEQDIERALTLYTDDVVWEGPNRGLIFHGKEAVADNYRRIWASMKDVEFHTLQRFATPDRVVDDSEVSLTLTRDDFFPPLKAGDKAKMRLVHIFEMRDGKIAKEIAFEMWKPA